MTLFILLVPIPITSVTFVSLSVCMYSLSLLYLGLRYIWMFVFIRYQLYVYVYILVFGLYCLSLRYLCVFVFVRYHFCVFVWLSLFRTIWSLCFSSYPVCLLPDLVHCFSPFLCFFFFIVSLCLWPSLSVPHVWGVCRRFSTVLSFDEKKRFCQHNPRTT
jgi:hypothetical protein